MRYINHVAYDNEIKYTQYKINSFVLFHFCFYNVCFNYTGEPLKSGAEINVRDRKCKTKINDVCRRLADFNIC